MYAGDGIGSAGVSGVEGLAAGGSGRGESERAGERESEKERARVVEYSGQAGRQASGQAGSEEASRQGTVANESRVLVVQSGRRVCTALIIGTAFARVVLGGSV